MNATSVKKYYTVAEAVEANLWPNQGGLRWLIFRAHENGLKRALRRVGRRVLIDADEFIRWMDEHAEEAA